MSDFAAVFNAASARVGGPAGLESSLLAPLTGEDLRAVGDDRYLSLISLRVFRAGLRHSVVDARWPAFEDAFAGFDPYRVRAFSDDDLDRLLHDARLIRHGPKLRSVLTNAAAMCDVIDEHGSFGVWLAAWPTAGIVDLWHTLKTRFSQLGGNSGPYFLRMAGKDTFILTDSVVRGLVQWAGLPPRLTSRRAQRMAQDVVNDWAEESGRPLCQISQVLAHSVD